MNLHFWVPDWSVESHFLDLVVFFFAAFFFFLPATPFCADPVELPLLTALLDFFCPKAAPQLSEYFCVVPDRRIVTALEPLCCC